LGLATLADELLDGGHGTPTRVEQASNSRSANDGWRGSGARRGSEPTRHASGPTPPVARRVLTHTWSGPVRVRPRSRNHGGTAVAPAKAMTPSAISRALSSTMPTTTRPTPSAIRTSQYPIHTCGPYRSRTVLPAGS